MSDLDIDLLRSLRSNVTGAIDSPYMLSCNSNIWSNSAPLQDIRFRNMIDLDFDLSRSLKVKCDGVIGPYIYGFLLMYIVTTCLSLSV